VHSLHSNHRRKYPNHRDHRLGAVDIAEDAVVGEPLLGAVDIAEDAVVGEPLLGAVDIAEYAVVGEPLGA
jgi:hypothetical protein